MTSLQSEGAGKAGSAERTRSRVCSVESTRVSHHRFAGNPRPSLRNGFNGFLRALLGEPGLLSPSPAQCESIVANLISASGYQDHTTSPSASPVFARRLRRAQAPFVFRHLRVHRIPHPTFVTTAKRPSFRARDARENAGDLPDVTSENACGRLARRANQRWDDKRAVNSKTAGVCAVLIYLQGCASMKRGAQNEEHL